MDILSPIPQFEYREATAPRHETAKAFMVQIALVKRFYRNEKSQVMYEVKPRDYVRLDRTSDLRAILDDEATPLRITGDLASIDCWNQLWHWLSANKWRLERLNPERPWAPERPANNGSALQQKQRWQT